MTNNDTEKLYTVYQKIFKEVNDSNEKKRSQSSNPVPPRFIDRRDLKRLKK